MISLARFTLTEIRQCVLLFYGCGIPKANLHSTEVQSPANDHAATSGFHRGTSTAGAKASHMPPFAILPTKALFRERGPAGEAGGRQRHCRLAVLGNREHRPRNRSPLHLA